MGKAIRLPEPAAAVVTMLLAGAAVAGIAAGESAATAPPPPAGGHEVVTWAAAPADLGLLPGFGVPAASVGQDVPAAPPAAVAQGFLAAPAAPAEPGASGAYRTVRDVVHTSAGGWDPRVRLSNVFGTGPVAFDDAEVTIPAPWQALPPGPERRVTFGGRGSVTIPPGREALSDPVPGYLPPETTLAVSLHVARGGGPVTGHPIAQQDSYLSAPGDYAAAGPARAWFPDRRWLYLDGIVVTVPRPVGTVVALGDSITDGYESAIGANARWPDDLARRLLALPPARRLAVANEGLSSNRVTVAGAGPDGGHAGPSARARFGGDVLAQPGVTAVILEEGINDIGARTVTSAGQLIAADTQLIARAHAAGLRILGGTLTPFAGAGYYSPAKDRIREQVNAWIRASGAFDGVVDFDRAVRDPASPSRLAPPYDSGDHIHPDDAGYRAMADAVNLGLLR